MKLTKLSAVALAAIAAMSIATASHSSSPCNSAYETIDAGAAILYIVNDDTGTWLYMESNSHANLQRGGMTAFEIGDGAGTDSDCWDIDAESGEMIENPDLALF